MRNRSIRYHYRFKVESITGKPINRPSFIARLEILLALRSASTTSIVYTMPSSSILAPCFFENLPAEMHEEISKYLDHGALLALSYTSKVCCTFTKPFLYRHVAICHNNVGLLLRTLVEKEEYRKMIFYLQSVLGIRGFHCDVVGVDAKHCKETVSITQVY